MISIPGGVSISSLGKSEKDCRRKGKILEFDTHTRFVAYLESCDNWNRFDCSRWLLFHRSTRLISSALGILNLITTTLVLSLSLLRWHFFQYALFFSIFLLPFSTTYIYVYVGCRNSRVSSNEKKKPLVARLQRNYWPGELIYGLHFPGDCKREKANLYS